jgi:hypothetical protein
MEYLILFLKVLAKILPGAALGIDALGEFKDVYRDTRKAISQLEPR